VAKVYVINLTQINPFWRAVSISLLTVGYVVVIDFKAGLCKNVGMNLANEIIIFILVICSFLRSITCW
jgi:hypothetical protein